MSSSSSMLTPTQRYAAAALFGLALHQAQIHQTRPLGSTSDDDSPSSQRSSSSSDSVSEDPQLWVHDSSNLLRPVFRFLDIDKSAWNGLEETAGNCSANHHVGAFLRLLSEDGGDASSGAEQQLALSKGVDAMVASMEKSAVDFESKKEKQREYESECREKFFSGVGELSKSDLDDKVANLQLENLPKDKDNANESLEKLSEVVEVNLENQRKHCNDKDESLEKLPISGKHPNLQVADTNLENEKKYNVYSIQEAPASWKRNIDDKPFEEIQMLGSSRKVAVLYELLSACLANKPDDSKKSTRQRKGYDARHRVALRLLATWFDIKWIQMEAIETMVACSAMALLKEEESKEETQSPTSKWAKWKRGGIIGAAALTGGTLMAITGGLAAPAIAAGFGALAPTLGTIVPVIGAGGFAAAASAAGSVAGSVAVGASFGAAGAGLTGSKVARRIGDVNEFEFKAIGENHNQGCLAVEILVSGFVFEEEDFMRPWEGLSDYLERYALKWESKHLIAVSTAIQDFLTSRLSMYLMKQGAMLTVLHALLTALAWPATLLMVTDIIDSKWTIAVDRSDKAGKLLAEDVLLKGLQGHRPVTLVGFSLGARVIFKCLQCLADSGHKDGLVERVVLLGAPVAIQDEGWEAARKVVAGRFINAYSTNDWMLGVAFRASLLTRGLAGIQPIDVPGIENVDVTEVIEGHSSYLWATQGILERLELDTYYPVFSGVVMKP